MNYIKNVVGVQGHLRIAPQEWHDGLIAGLHPGRSGDMMSHNPDKFLYERRPESTAYIPYGRGKHYVCGALTAVHQMHL